MLASRASEPILSRAGVIVFELLLAVFVALLNGMIYFQSYYHGPLPVEIQLLCPAPFKHACRGPISDPLNPRNTMMSLGIPPFGATCAHA